MTSVDFAKQVRRHSLQMVTVAKASHIGGALSCADILSVLYAPNDGVLHVQPEQPQWPQRDRFVMSKGHSCSALYAALALRGFFPIEEIETYGRDGTRLASIVSHRVPGVELSALSLGHGLSYGCGLALAAKRKRLPWRVVVLLGDGEMQEGSCWEAAMFAAHHNLDNLVAVVDANGMQAMGSVQEVLRLPSLTTAFRAFEWAVRECHGHDHAALRQNLQAPPWWPGKPSLLLAHTVKGKGVDFMEDKLEWHYRSPSQEQCAAALEQVA